MDREIDPYFQIRMQGSLDRETTFIFKCEAEIYGPLGLSGFNKGETGIHGPPNRSADSKGDTGIHGPLYRSGF